jgi:imidazole glycerol-phosphate synthase subunit HisH
MIAIVDYGMGNLGSIQNMLKRIGAQATITNDPAKIGAADKIILPGVGAFGSAMENLNKLGLTAVLNDLVLEKRRPILGICLGMQLMTKRSDEGALPGLGWLDAETVRFENGALRVPHMGWNTVDVKHADPLFKDMYEEPRFYFVHSYYVRCADESDILTSTRYGIDFCSSFAKGNIRGVQYHPEKSHKFGMLLLKNFAELV